MTTNIKVLLAEDKESDREACRESAELYAAKNDVNIELIECSTPDEVNGVLDNSFDAAIVDLKLGKIGDEGNTIIKSISEKNYRIPVAIMTGTPDHVDDTLVFIDVYKKGEVGYDEIFRKITKINNTGITRILGGRGVIETTLEKVFKSNLIKQLDVWVEYGEQDPDRTEKALLRHTLNHLIQLLDDDADVCYPEEFYLFPPIDENYKTGSIIKDKKSGDYYIVMSPPCDLAVRGDGEINTHKILVIGIDKVEAVHQPQINEIKKPDKKKKFAETTYKNRHTLYHHWLPMTGYFDGGFVNFRDLNTYSLDELNDKFGKPELQVSPSFVKDILARFSAYYSRQGQPEVDMAKLLSEFDK